MNQEIEQYLRIFVNFHQTDWDEWLGLAEFAHNDKQNASTKMSPFYADHGYHPWKGIETRHESKNETAQEFADKMKKIRDEATAAMGKAQQKMTENYNRHRRPTSELHVGQKVWLEAKDVRTERPSKKLADKRLGPYEILEKVGEAAWKLKIPGREKRYPVYHEGLLTPYKEPPPHRCNPRPPPDIIDDEEEHEVEAILKKRRSGRSWEYYIKWQGYPHSENTWEPESNLEHAQELLNEFNNCNVETQEEEEYTPRSWPLKEDSFLKRYKTTKEKEPYPQKYLSNWLQEDGKTWRRDRGEFIPINTVDEDIDLKEGVMARFDTILRRIDDKIREIR
jgi:hypothetical protein